MGIVVFEWGDKQLTLLQNRDTYDAWATRPAAWDENNQILSGRLEEKYGTWFGISKQGRVAFFLDAVLLYELSDSVLLPIDFLKGQKSPGDFARELCEDSKRNHGLAYNLIVAYINSNSMFYISKMFRVDPHIRKEEVGFGVHTLSLTGLDWQAGKDACLKDRYEEMMGHYKYKPLPSMRELAERFMYDPHPTVENDKMSAFLVDMIRLRERYRTSSTTALVVKPTKEVKFFERFLDLKDGPDGQWYEYNFTFKITA